MLYENKDSGYIFACVCVGVSAFIFVIVIKKMFLISHFVSVYSLICVAALFSKVMKKPKY